MDLCKFVLLIDRRGGDGDGGGGGGGDEPASEGLLLENSSFVQLESGDFVLIEG
jgi:hypothetical protein